MTVFLSASNTSFANFSGGKFSLSYPLKRFAVPTIPFPFLESWMEKSEQSISIPLESSDTTQTHFVMDLLKYGLNLYQLFFHASNIFRERNSGRRRKKDRGSNLSATPSTLTPSAKKDRGFRYAPTAFCPDLDSMYSPRPTFLNSPSFKRV